MRSVGFAAPVSPSRAGSFGEARQYATASLFSAGRPIWLTGVSVRRSRQARPLRRLQATLSAPERNNDTAKNDDSLPEIDAYPLRAKTFKTGARLLLSPCPSALPSSVRRYIRCPSCSTAYVGNAVVSETDVRCPSCSHVFKTSPAQLLVAVDPAQSGPKTNDDEQDDRRQSADPYSIVCKHFGPCPGCSSSTGLLNAAVVDHAKAFARNALKLRKPMTIEMGPAMGWRTHAKLAIRRKRIGLFKMRSHDVVEIPECSVHHPAINSAAKALQKAMDLCGTRSYDEISMKGQARYALFTVERDSGKVQVTVVWNASSWKEANPGATRLGARLWNENRDLLHSVWFNWNTSSGNVIASQKEDAFYCMHGPAMLRERVGGAKVYFAPTVFRQANLDAFESLLLPRLLSYVPRGSSVVELHGGVGVISLALLQRQGELNLRSIVVTEINQFGAAPFRRALSQFDGSVRNLAEYSVGSDDDSVEYAVYGDASLVIVDPPRAGVSERCLTELANPPGSSPLRRLIYVSCGFDSFQRDARKLLEGQWKASAAHGFLFFPGTNHVEILAVFDREIRTLRNR